MCTMMVKLSNLVNLTVGVYLGLGYLSHQSAIAGTLGPDFSEETIQEISLIVNEVSIIPESSSTDYRLGLQLKVSFLDEEEQEAERTWFINRDGSFNDVGSFFALRFDFCESSDPSSVCHSLFDNFITINNRTASDQEFSRTGDQIDPKIVDLLTNGVDNNVRLEANFIGIGNRLVGILQQSTTEQSAFFVSTPPAIEPVAIPEPLTILGSVTAMGFGTFFKRKLSRSKSSSKKG